MARRKPSGLPAGRSFGPSPGPNFLFELQEAAPAATQRDHCELWGLSAKRTEDCRAFAAFCFQTKDSTLATAIWPYLQHVGYPSYWIDAFVSSDHISFHASGIPAVTLSDSTDASGLYHTPQDVPELLDAGRIAAVAAGVATFLAQQAAPLSP